MTPERQAAQSMSQAESAFAGFMTIMFPFAIFVIGVWLWMLIDCLTRSPWAFPGGNENSMFVWALLLIFIPPIGLPLYLLLVYFPGRRGRPSEKPQAYYSDRR